MTAKPIPSLTGLRGVAVVWVVFFHMMLGGQPIAATGFLGVDVFFILSGFVLAHVYGSRFQAHGWSAYGPFLRARVARIYPLHLAMLGVLIVIVLAVPGFASSYPDPARRFGLDCLAASAFLIQNWFHWIPLCWNGPSWSLSAEWLAYLMFPVFVFATQRWRSPVTAVCLAALCLSAFVAIIWLKGISTINLTGDPGLLRMGLEFACGCLVFRAMGTGLAPLPPLADLAALALLAAALIAGATALAPFAFALMVLLAAQEKGWIAKLLSTRPVVFLGEISYSIYLVHWIVLQFTNRLSSHFAANSLPAILLCAGAASLILALSLFTYRWIEIPARAWGRKIGVRPATILANADAI